MRLIALGSLPVLAVALAAAPSAEAKPIDTGSASGDYAIAQASGNVKKPGTIRVKVTASPRQKVSVNWTMVCSQPDGGAGSKDGKFTAKTPVTRTLKKPAKKVTDCTVSALAQLSDSGKIKITLTG
jgi:hypothetical protein